MLHSTNPSRESGFTLVELVTVIVVLGILMIPLTIFTTNYFGAMIGKNTEAQLASESQILLRSITEELRTSSAILPSATLNDPNMPPAGWQTSNTNLIIIISTPALNTQHKFIIDPLAGTPYQNQIIYYTSGNSLYRRYLANPDATGNTTVTSCPPSATTSSCPSDVLLTSHFSAMSFTLYDQDDVVTTNISQARSIIVNVTMSQKMYGRTIQYKNSMRMTMRNKA